MIISGIIIQELLIRVLLFTVELKKQQFINNGRKCLKHTYLIYEFCFCNKLVSFIQPRIVDMGTSKLHTYLQSKFIKVSYKPKPLCSFQLSRAASGNGKSKETTRQCAGKLASQKEVKWSQL